MRFQVWIISLIGFAAQLRKKLARGTDKIRVRQENETSFATKTSLKTKKRKGVRGSSAVTQGTPTVQTELPLGQALGTEQGLLLQKKHAVLVE